jgi:hypothetical protein
MNPLNKHKLEINRRHFFGRASTGLGVLGLSSLINPNAPRSAHANDSAQLRNQIAGLPHLPHFAPKAKRVIYLFQSGGPSQLDLYDHKPQLQKFAGKEVPLSIYPAERKTTMTSAQTSFATAPSALKFTKHQGGATFSETLPNIAREADDICVINSMYTEAINHDPAITFFQTGSQIPGRPSIGAWMSYGLGSHNANLPAFVAMSSRGSAKNGQPIYDRLWGSGFLPAQYQGVKFRNQGDPVLDISNPSGVDRATRRKMLDTLEKLNRKRQKETGDKSISSRISQYELAYRMQMSVPELTDFSNETTNTFELYGQNAKKPGTYAYNCLMARRLAERGVRFIQLFHQGWDQHTNAPKGVRAQSRDTDQASAALLRDLKQRGMLDDTLIIWGGEFGRTVYSQGKITNNNYGRDHHAGCMSMWMAGGGIKGGMKYGATDDYSANVVENPVHVHDLQATIMHQMGINHELLTYKYQGRHFRLTDVHGKVVKPILA